MLPRPRPTGSRGARNSRGGSHRRRKSSYVGGSFQNGAGLASADYLLACDLVSDTASSTVLDPARPFSGSVYALAIVDRELFAAGSFAVAGGDAQAHSAASFRFASGEPGSRFTCKLDAQKSRPCTSPKTYRKLKRGKHVFRVKARDRAGNVDATPAVKRFRIKEEREIP